MSGPTATRHTPNPLNAQDLPFYFNQWAENLENTFQKRTPSDEQIAKIKLVFEISYKDTSLSSKSSDLISNSPPLAPLVRQSYFKIITLKSEYILSLSPPQKKLPLKDFQFPHIGDIVSIIRKGVPYSLKIHASAIGLKSGQCLPKGTWRAIAHKDWITS